MKYIKTFQQIYSSPDIVMEKSITTLLPSDFKFKIGDEFNIGDKVLCIDGYPPDSLYKNQIYEIEDIKRIVRHEYLVSLKLYGVDYEWAASRFRKCTPKEIKKYELQNIAKKYNIG